MAFNSSLVNHRLAYRWRGIGHPATFLDRVGIGPIQERLTQGRMLIHVAEELNVPLTVLTLWLEDRGHNKELEKATVQSAEGYLWRGERLLESAETPFELQKARLMLERGRFMAKAKDRPQYGDNMQVQASVATVSYQFVVNAQPPSEPPPAPIDVTPKTALANPLELVTFDLDWMTEDERSERSERAGNGAPSPVDRYDE